VGLREARGGCPLKKDDLLVQIESQSDPAWIEMLIKKKLGMVADGQTKVYFER